LQTDSNRDGRDFISFNVGRNEHSLLTESPLKITKMGLSQEMAYQPVAKKSLPPKPKKVQADMRLELRNLPKKPEPSMDTSGHIWTHLDSIDTPDMEQPDFAWPTNLEEESHPNQVSLQEEVSWNNNPQMLDQLFHGSLLEKEQQVEEMQLVEQVGEVEQVEQSSSTQHVVSKTNYNQIRGGEHEAR
jgi:hypothetical protein